MKLGPGATPVTNEMASFTLLHCRLRKPRAAHSQAWVIANGTTAFPGTVPGCSHNPLRPGPVRPGQKLLRPGAGPGQTRVGPSPASESPIPSGSRRRPEVVVAAAGPGRADR